MRQAVSGKIYKQLWYRFTPYTRASGTTRQYPPNCLELPVFLGQLTYRFP